MKQKIVIKVSMSCDKSRSKAMALAARTYAIWVISMGITGDGRDQLELVGDGIDPVCLVSCLRKKLGHAQIMQVEEVKEKKPEEKKPDEAPKPPPTQCYAGGYYYHHPQMIVCDEPSNCAIM